MSYASRQSQSKAQNEANAKTLRALVKQPENKICADCKRNDPRWASWNLGCFLCIRCSGIHRSMGTHISKVKSIDLDIWTPEQMESIQKWGNKLCNLYWEAHLKAGHVPPEHKIESFIRSKYETRRWAKDGPPPSDPSVLDGGAPVPSSSTTRGSGSTSQPQQRAVKPASAVDLLGGDAPPPPSQATTSLSQPSARQPSNLLDDPPSNNGRTTSGNIRSPTSPPAPAAPPKTHTAPSPAAAAAPSGGGGGGLFDLDWHSGPTSPPAVSSPTGGAKGKNDILSLFSSATPAPAPPLQQQHQQQQGGFGGLDAFGAMNLGGAQSQGPARAAQTQSSSGLFSTQDVWGAPTSVQQSRPQAPTTTTATTTTSSFGGGGFGGDDIWGDMTSGAKATATPSSATTAPKKDDAFADIWGDFK
ncbi:ArfGap-domain-containing protein [Acaromyces ingoldii]|uniref:ArfGap-domain-containing protein n=1 Tax=Acaromyces ingoldii TaxID=215250 RepID=A0A316YRM2_9BASI|nr:ArfGap-domain-containing protein [Acaromyces ingoldii]PWN90425.1 ArfGap-domain-containing protein [Acaromyces ingoldii]